MFMSYHKIKRVYIYVYIPYIVRSTIRLILRRNNEKVLYIKILKICIYDIANYIRYHKIKRVYVYIYIYVYMLYIIQNTIRLI